MSVIGAGPGEVGEAAAIRDAAGDLPFQVLATNALAVALTAALFVQVSHEATHGLAALLVGARWQALNLFASQHSWPGAASEAGDVVIAGSAAILNILVGFLCVALFSWTPVVDRPLLRLFLLYTGAYSLFTGFGYLMFDPLFYQPGADVGDWKVIVGMLGGGWEVRIPLILIGAAGVLAGFFWLAYSALKFDPWSNEPQRRVRIALPLLLVPYLGVNAIVTVLAFWHPVGPDGVLATILQYWLGYIGFFWGFFLAGYWLTIKAPPSNPTHLPARVSIPWVVSAAVLLAVAIVVLLPTVYF